MEANGTPKSADTKNTRNENGIKESEEQPSIVNPLSIILVKNGSKGDRLVFRYPFIQIGKDGTEKVPETKQVEGPDGTKISPPGQTSTPIATEPTSTPEGQTLTRSSSSDSLSTPVTTELTQKTSPPIRPIVAELKKRRLAKSKPPTFARKSNPYAVSVGNDLFDTQQIPSATELENPSDILSGLSDKDLSNLLAVSTELSERKFELKINQVRFVGHPTLMQHPSIERPVHPTVQTSVKLFHIVFCLHARASHSIVKCFFDLSKRLGIALRHEEYRCAYVSREMKDTIGILDEFQSQSVDIDESTYLQQCHRILNGSSLAQLLKSVYDSVCDTGFVKVRVNKWVQISFCLPQKIHILPFRVPPPIVEPEKIHKCLEAIRPYHAILLLVDREELAATFWLDSSPTIPRLMQVYSPLKSLQTIAADGDLSLSHVVEVASHLVYWALATVIYPICESNLYVIAPDAPIASADLEEAFMDSFPGFSLGQTLGDFSLPMPIGERVNPMLGGSYLQAQVVQLVCWLLKNRLLVQLHTYIYLTTYLDGPGTEDSMISSSFFQNLEFDGPMHIRTYEHDEEDDVTVSDSYSETTGDEVREASPISDRELRNSLGPLFEAESLIPPDTELVSFVTGNFDAAGPTNNGEGEESGSGSAAAAAVDKFQITMSELNDAVKRAVASVKTSVSIQDIKIFSRLSKYFTGEYHLEEIMYIENVRRSQLFLMLDKFRDVLVTVEKEDTDIDFFRIE